jgi:hypothetical protein
METTTPDSEVALLKPRAVASRLGISFGALWKLTNRGDLQSIRDGQVVRYDPTDVEAFVRRQNPTEGASTALRVGWAQCAATSILGTRLSS